MITTARQLKDLIRNLSKKKSADAQILMRLFCAPGSRTGSNRCTSCTVSPSVSITRLEWSTLGFTKPPLPWGNRMVP